MVGAHLGIGIRRRLDDSEKLGNSLLIGSRIAWVRNRRALATEMANEAASVLESVGGLPLATAYSAISPAGDVGRRREANTLVWGEGPGSGRRGAEPGPGTRLKQHRDGQDHRPLSRRHGGAGGELRHVRRHPFQPRPDPGRRHISWGAIYYRDLRLPSCGRAGPTSSRSIGNRFIRCVCDRGAGPDRRDEGELGGSRSEGLLRARHPRRAGHGQHRRQHLCLVDFRPVEASRMPRPT